MIVERTLIYSHIFHLYPRFFLLQDGYTWSLWNRELGALAAGVDGVLPGALSPFLTSPTFGTRWVDLYIRTYIYIYIYIYAHEINIYILLAQHPSM